MKSFQFSEDNSLSGLAVSSDAIIPGGRSVLIILDALQVKPRLIASPGILTEGSPTWQLLSGIIGLLLFLLREKRLREQFDPRSVFFSTATPHTAFIYAFVPISV